MRKFLSMVLKLVGQLAVKLKPTIKQLTPPEYEGQGANDFLRRMLESDAPNLMVAKFGTYELKAMICFNSYKEGIRRLDIANILRNRYVLFRGKQRAMKRLCHNAGFFPNVAEMGARYADLVIEDYQQTDILSSYQPEEAYLEGLTAKPLLARVDLEGFYAPFLWEKPWTSALKGKRVLVIHPFTESIKSQYAKREQLFPGTNVLPQFKELHLIKAVQSIAGNEVGYGDWFQALEAMKQQMEQVDFDVALIGCGAYGFHLAAHAKRMGKTGILLAGWTQMLFGIYGNRWTVDQPKFARFINDAWIRPLEHEQPKNAETVEGGCYW